MRARVVAQLFYKYGKSSEPARVFGDLWSLVMF